MSGTDSIGPESQRAMNPVTLERLRGKGSDLSWPHRLHNVFHVYRSSDVAVLCSDLEAAGFIIDDTGTPLDYQGTRYWKIEACMNEVPALVTINSMTDRCAEVASRHDADYDGWYTEMVSPSEQVGDPA